MYVANATWIDIKKHWVLLLVKFALDSSNLNAVRQSTRTHLLLCFTLIPLYIIQHHTLSPGFLSGLAYTFPKTDLSS
jgi:hypothetical protein